MFQRPDGRKPNELRPIKIVRKYTRYAAGSVFISYGNTQVLVTASVEERVPRHVFQTPNENEGWLTAEYSLLPGSTHTRTQRERNRVSGRTSEIQRLIGRCLRASLDLQNLGQRTITVDADVIQADGGTRVAAITGGFVAIMDALHKLQEEEKLKELPLISPVAAVSVGLIEGNVFLDLNYEEDFTACVDANIVMNADDKLIEFQATSEGSPFSRDELNEMLDTAHNGIRQLLALQQEALNEAGVTV